MPMKNLAIRSVDIDNLPLKESRKEFLTSEYGDMYNINRFDSGSSSNKNPINYNFNLAKRILKKYVNKPFDEAYSDYSSKAEKYGKEIFKEFFNIHTYVHTLFPCYIDEQGIIRKVDTDILDKVYHVYSWDYKEKLEYDNVTKTHIKTILSGKVFTFKHKNHLYYKELYKQRSLKRKAKRNLIKNKNI